MEKPSKPKPATRRKPSPVKPPTHQQSATTATTRARPPAKPRRSREATDRTAGEIAKMTREELCAFVQAWQAEQDRQDPDRGALTEEAASSDLLRVILAAGLLFARRYYPNANHMSLDIGEYRRDKSPDQHSRIAIPLPTPGTTPARS